MARVPRVRVIAAVLVLGASSSARTIRGALSGPPAAATPALRFALRSPGCPARACGVLRWCRGLLAGTVQGHRDPGELGEFPSLLIAKQVELAPSALTTTRWWWRRGRFPDQSVCRAAVLGGRLPYCAVPSRWAVFSHSRLIRASAVSVFLREGSK